MPRFPISTVLTVLVMLSGTGGSAHAQGARGLPDPISSSNLVDLLQGLEEVDLELMAVPIETYHAAFRRLRGSAIEQWLEEKRGRSDGFFGSDDLAAVADEARTRASLANRIAALEDRLFRDLEAAGIDEEIVDLARDARSRDRSRTLAGGRYTRGLRFEPIAVYEEIRAEVSGSPQWAVDAAVRRILEAHDEVRTTKLANLARAAMRIPVERTELLRGLDLGMPDPETEGFTSEDFARWFAARREAEREAAGEVRTLQSALMATDHRTLEQILLATGGETDFAVAFREAWLAEAHAGLFPDRRSPASLFDAAREMHADGELDDETLEVVESIEASWRTRHRDIEDRMLRALEKAVKIGRSSGMSMLAGLEDELDSASDSNPEPSDLDEARQARADLDRETRTRLGEIAPERLASRVKEDDTSGFPFGDDAEGVEAAFAIGVFAGEPMDLDGGEIAIDLADFTGDIDFGEAAVLVSTAIGGPAAASGDGLARPMDREWFDRLLERLEVDDATRPIVTALFVDYREGWAEIDATLVTEWNELPKGGIGAEGLVMVEEDALARKASLRLAVLDAVLALDRALFGDLRVLSSQPATITREAAERRREVCIEAVRIRGFVMTSDARMATLDLAGIARENLDESRALAITGLLDEWGRIQTPALEDRARSLIELERAIAVEQQRMERIFHDQRHASRPAIELEIDASTMARFQALRQRSGAVGRSTSETNTSWVRRIASALADVAKDDADAFLLAVDRETWPRCFEDGRTPRANFDRALALENLDDGTRVAMETLRGEWLASWTSACRELVAIERDGPRMDLLDDPTGFDPVALQKAQSEKRRIRFDRNELNERTFRELKSLLSPEQQEVVGDLPEAGRRMLPPGLGGMEMIIGG